MKTPARKPRNDGSALGAAAVLLLPVLILIGLAASAAGTMQ